MMINDEEIRKWLAVMEKCESVGEANGAEMFGLLKELVPFLMELNEFLSRKHTPRAVLQEIPSVGKFLGTLTQNCIIQCSEEAVKILFQCIFSLASHNARVSDSTTRKTIAWAQSQIKHMASPSPTCPGSLLLIGHGIGNTATEVTQTMTDKLVLSICHDLMEGNGTKWNPLINDLAPSLKHSGLTLRNLSEMCLPFITESVARPLIESLLLAGNSSADISSTSDESFTVDDCLSAKFLDLITEMTRQTHLDPNIKGCGYRKVLSYDALVALWRRYQPSFESQVFDILEFAVVSHPGISVHQVKDLMTACHLTKACVEHVQLRETATQLIYSFMYSLPDNPRLHDVLRAVRESCTQSQS